MMHYLIHSYPRSGNHIFRSVIELSTRRPTLGCLTNPNDRPILQNLFQSDQYYLSRDPVGIKSHFSWELYRNLDMTRSAGLIPYGVFIFRNPRDSIASVITRTCLKKQMTPVEIMHLLDRECFNWLDGIAVCQQFLSLGHKASLIDFNKLIDKDCSPLSLLDSPITKSNAQRLQLASLQIARSVSAPPVISLINHSESLIHAALESRRELLDSLVYVYQTLLSTQGIQKSVPLPPDAGLCRQC